MIVSKEKSYFFIYAFLSIIIVLSVGVDKQFFTLDFPVGSNVYNGHIIPTFYGFEVPVWGGLLVWKLVYSLLILILSVPITQKILLFSVLFLAGCSANSFVPADSQKAKLFAGLLYMLNPYTYIRIIVGHWFILFAYAMLPLAIKAFIELLEKKGRKQVVKSVLLLTLVGFNIHTLLIALIAMSVIFLFWFWQNRDPEAIKIVALTGAFFILLNSYWLIPLATAKDTLVSSIGSEDLTAFSPRIESFSALFTLASMHGFWRAGYIYAKDVIPYWEVLFAFTLFLSVQGFLSHYRDKKIGIYVKAFGVIAVLGLILAAGINSPFPEVFQWLFDNTPLKGMRDSHKFVTLLALSYAYLGALEISEFEKLVPPYSALTKYKNIAARAIIVAALITPLLYSFTFFNGFSEQIRSTDYPPDWYEVNGLLDHEPGDFKVLFFPWHQYMNFHWVPNRDNRIANPAQHFFDKEVISGKNVEIGEVYRQVYSPDQLYIDFLLKEQDRITSFGQLVAPLNIKFILLTKEADYEKYLFLFNQSDLELVKETDNFYVFRNKHEIAKIYEVDNITYIRDWEELLERSRKEDITKRVFIIGDSSANSQESSEKKILGYEEINPAKYELSETPSKRYLVFTEPYSENWELDSKKPMAAYGVVNAYEKDKSNGKEIRFERFYKIYLFSYIISLLSFIVLVAFYLEKSIRINAISLIRN